MIAKMHKCYNIDGSTRSPTTAPTSAPTASPTVFITRSLTVPAPGAYYLDSELRADANLKNGLSYRFTHPSSHPVRFSFKSDGTHSGGTEYTTDVKYNAQSTEITIPSGGLRQNLYYYCSRHPGMGGIAFRFDILLTVPTSGAYYLDGNIKANANLQNGQTYRFTYPTAHPLKFSFVSDGTHNSGSEYTTGVVNPSAGVTEITIPAGGLTQTLYYYSGALSGMGGILYVGPTDAPTEAPTAAPT